MINLDESNDQITISHVNNYEKYCPWHNLTKFLSQILISIADLRVKYMIDKYNDNKDRDGFVGGFVTTIL